MLVKGKNRCTLIVNPVDAAWLGLEEGEKVAVRSRVGEVEIEVEVSDAIMPGVVSIPHGWGHVAAGTNLEIAAQHSGVNTNLLVDEKGIDPLSGNAILTGVRVTIGKKAVVV